MIMKYIAKLERGDREWSEKTTMKCIQTFMNKNICIMIARSNNRVLNA